jgi:citrate lyase subunit beta / citryl-CoA lyase
MLIRRSNLLVPLQDAGFIENAWRYDADAVTLCPDDAGSEGERVRGALGPVARGAAEVFVRVRAARLDDDLEAAVWPGLSGIVLADVEAAAQVAQAAAHADTLERERGLSPRSLTFILQISAPRGVWDMRSLVRASGRVSQAGLDEPALAHALGIDCVPAYDPFVYARGRLAIECTAAKVGAIGMAWPMSVFENLDASEKEVHELAVKAKNLGMKGILCRHASWVAPINAAFTPTPALVEWNRRVREAFTAGVAAGTAAVPLDGKMIDVPVDEWAKVVLETAQACAARDAQKATARGRALARPGR